MIRKWVAIGLIAFLAIISVDKSAWAQTAPQSETELKELKIKVLQYAEPGGPRVDVKLRDKTRMKGYIRQTGGSTFDVVDSRFGNSVTVNYSEVKTVSAPRTWVKIVKWVGIGWLALIVVGGIVGAATD